MCHCSHQYGPPIHMATLAGQTVRHPVAISFPEFTASVRYRMECHRGKTGNINGSAENARANPMTRLPVIAQRLLASYLNSTQVIINTETSENRRVHMVTGLRVLETSIETIAVTRVERAGSPSPNQPGIVGVACKVIGQRSKRVCKVIGQVPIRAMMTRVEFPRNTVLTV
jgi:hypothetical protein